MFLPKAKQSGFLKCSDHIITTVCEHNSVLRQLYRLREQGLQFSFAGVDERGRLQYEMCIRDRCEDWLVGQDRCYRN